MGVSLIVVAGAMLGIRVAANAHAADGGKMVPPSPVPGSCSSACKGLDAGHGLTPPLKFML